MVGRGNLPDVSVAVFARVQQCTVVKLAAVRFVRWRQQFDVLRLLLVLRTLALIRASAAVKKTVVVTSL